MRKTIAILWVLLLSLSATAYDFHKSIGGGNRLYFHILDENSVEVVCPNQQYGNPYGDFLKPIGRVAIPSTVVHDGASYAVVAIGCHAFEGCDDMKAVAIPASVRRIGAAAFRGCTALRAVNVESVVLEEVDMPFMGCNKLDSLIIAETVRSLPAFAFSEMDNLKVVLFNAEQPERMRNIFYGSHAKVRLMVGPKAKSIPDEMCYNFVGLQVVAGGHALESIGREAFCYCLGLDSVLLPSSLTRLGGGAFSFCQLGKIVIRCSQLPHMSANPFMGVNARTYVVVPCGMRDEWRTSIVGRHFDRLYYDASCMEKTKGQNVTEYVRDTVVRYDTIWLHDTIVIHDTVYRDEPATADSLCYYVEGRSLILEHIDQFLGKSYMLYDDRGRVVESGQIPLVSSERYAIRLPRRKRYFLTIQGIQPVAIDAVMAK